MREPAARKSVCPCHGADLDGFAPAQSVQRLPSEVLFDEAVRGSSAPPQPEPPTSFEPPASLAEGIAAFRSGSVDKVRKAASQQVFGRRRRTFSSAESAAKHKNTEEFDLFD